MDYIEGSIMVKEIVVESIGNYIDEVFKIGNKMQEMINICI